MDDTFGATPTRLGGNPRSSLFRIPQAAENTFAESPTAFGRILQSVDDTLAASPIQKPKNRRASARMSIGPGPKTSEPKDTAENRMESFFELDITSIPHASANRLSLAGRQYPFDDDLEAVRPSQNEEPSRELPWIKPSENRRETFLGQMELTSVGRVPGLRMSLGGRGTRRETFGLLEEIERAEGEASRRLSLGTTVLDTDVTTVGGKGAMRRSIFYSQGDDTTQIGEPTNFMDNTALNAIMQLQDNPLIKDTERLHQAFHEVVADLKSNIIFSQIQQFEKALEPHVTQLRNVTKVLPRQHHRFQELRDVELALGDELFTWRLICSLYTDRFLVAPDTESSDYAIEQLSLKKRFISDKEVIDKLFETDAPIRQAQLVIDWLELSANEVFETFSAQNLELMVGETRGWEMTVATLQRSNGNPQGNMVTEVDTDAPLRQGRPLHPHDAEDLLMLNQGVFRRIRSGQINRAQEMLIAAGHPMLALRLEGWRPFHDPNFDIEGQFDHSVQRLPAEGNPRRSLWKKVAWAFCEDTKVPAYERAALGAYSGHLNSMLEVAEGWLDALWAHLKVLVDQGIEKVVRSHDTTTGFFAKIEDLPEGYLQKEWDLERVFESVTVFCKSKILTDRNNPIHIIQKYIILDDCDALVEQADLWLSDEKGPLQGHLLRFLCHALIFLKRIGRLSSDEAGANVIAAYVKELMKSEQFSLVAWYTGELPEELQAPTYAEFLEPLTMAPLEEKHILLELAKRSGLDVKNIAIVVAHSTRLRREEELPGLVVSDEVPPLPVFQIFGLQWLLWDGAPLAAEALSHSNALCRVFLLAGGHQEAQTVLSALPDDILEQVKKESMEESNVESGNEVTELPPREENAVREHRCLQLYLSSQRLFEDWLSVLHSKPTAPEKPKGFENRLVNHHFAEQLAYEKKERAFKMDLGKWESRLLATTETIIRRLRDELLKFPDGWLVDTAEEKKPNEEREREIELLRRECIPQSCSLLYQVLISSKKINEIQQLESLVLDPAYRITEAFRPDELDEFLEKIRRAESH